MQDFSSFDQFSNTNDPKQKFLREHRSQIDLLPLEDKTIFSHWINNNTLTLDQAEIVLKVQEMKGLAIKQICMTAGFVSEKSLPSEDVKVAQKALLKDLDPSCISKVTRKVTLNLRAIPMKMDGSTLHIAAEDDTNVMPVDVFRQFFPQCSDYKIHKFGWSQILECINIHLSDYESVDVVYNELRESGGLILEQEGKESPIIRLVDSILQQALQQNVSDIHLEPDDAFVRLRYRISGVLEEIKIFDKEYWKAMLIRIKVISDMNIAETRLPQDGKISMIYMGRKIDFRVGTQPTVHGENIVIRVLDNEKNVFSLNTLGLLKYNFEKMMRIVNKPNGLVIVTGPTGSGKTTTLYSILNYLNSSDVNIMTLEDPVEYTLPLIRQSSVKESIGFSFESGIKALLRQGPDIILVGEVRDGPTARAMMRAVMTGHRVYTTLHTQDTVGTIDRLLDLGVDRSIIAGNVSAILAQRLLRRLCDSCKKPYSATDLELEQLGVTRQVFEEKKMTIYQPNGCPKCRNTGYTGRMSVLEILEFDNILEDLVLSKAGRSTIYKAAIANGLKTLKHDICTRIFLGQTDIEEGHRIFDIKNDK